MHTPFVPCSIVGAGSVAGVAADKKKKVSVCSVGMELGDIPPSVRSDWPGQRRETPGHHHDEQRGTTLPEHLAYGGISLSCDAALSPSALYIQNPRLSFRVPPLRFKGG